jgi:hypothetical protein
MQTPLEKFKFLRFAALNFCGSIPAPHLVRSRPFPNFPSLPSTGLVRPKQIDDDHRADDREQTDDGIGVE